MKIMHEMNSKNSVGSQSPLLYICQLLSSAIALLYMLLMGHMMVAIVQVLSLAFNGYYVMTFYNLMHHKTMLYAQLAAVIGVGAFILVYVFFLTADPLEQLSLLGRIIILLQIVNFVSPLAQLPTILRLKTAASVPVPWVVASIVACALWTMYGISLDEIVLTLPNAIGLVLNLILIVLVFKFGTSAPRTSDLLP
jgi:uncharacterized protein with PQ loop repeat